MAKTKNSTSIIIAKTLAVTGFAASVLLTAAPAHALDFTFSFQDTDGGDGTVTGTQGYITGTLSGLVEGSNSGTGITATVTSSPGGNGVGSGYSYLGGGTKAFVVSGGNIIFADVYFGDSSSDPNYLYLGTLGNSGYNSELVNDSISYSYGDSSSSTTKFTPVPFELNSTVGLATLGICFGAAKLRRKYLAKKLAVSQDKGLVEV